MGKPGFPMPPPPREGLGVQSPPRNNRMFIAALCGGAAWRAAVTIVRRVQPPSQPPPAGGRRRVPAPGGEGPGRGGHRARGAAMRAGRPRSQGMCIAAWCTMRMTVSREHKLSKRGMGKPAFPSPPPPKGSRAWPSCGGIEKPAFPSPSPGGRVWGETHRRGHNTACAAAGSKPSRSGAL